jgi:hypothetical protein
MSVGMVIMRPTSVVVAGAGSSASVRAAGGVEFATATSLSLNGVFNSAYDDYMIVMQVSQSALASTGVRLRLSGSDASDSNYVQQILYASNTNIAARRDTSQTLARFQFGNSLQRNGFTAYLYGPNLTQPTASRSVTVATELSANIEDYAWTHSLSTAYDGLSLIMSTGTTTGLVTVYGLSQ